MLGAVGAPVILVLSDLWQPFPGGAERLMFNLARYLHQRGERVHVLTGYEHAEQLDGPPVTSMPIGVFDTRDEGAELIKAAIAEHRPEVIVAHHLYASQFEPELIGSGVPLIHVVLNGQRIRGAAAAVYISRWVRERTRPEPGDLTITPPVFSDVVAAEHGDAIGFIKPIEHKGVALVYEIAEAMPDRPFLILRGEWQTLEDIRYLPNVAFMEPVVDMRDFYRRCRVILMPSLSEDAGTVAQEAAANGLPCISSAVGGLAETNAGGILLDPADARPWIVAIQSLDAPGFYAETVTRQGAALTALDHVALLARFADRVRDVRRCYT